MKWFSLHLFLLETVLFNDGMSVLQTFDNPRLSVDSDSGSPLILTPYVESGSLEMARDLARVEFPGFPEIRCYAGFFTVDKTFNSNQFLWYFPAENYVKEQAVILWLQGGPGASSLIGLFNENGPLKVQNGSFQEREINWVKRHNVIYIDSPVGAGFSFTNDSRGYCTNQTQIGEHLYSTLSQFFQIFPELKDYPFFISGESYGGKYVPALGYTIHKNNKESKQKIYLKGLIIGNGWSDPINQLDYNEYLYQLGLIDWNLQKEVEDYQNQIAGLIRNEAWPNATNAIFNLYEFILNSTGNVSLINYILETEFEDDIQSFIKLIESDSIRKDIHIGNVTYDMFSSEVFDVMKADIMMSVAPWISELLEHYHILFYNGQLDINVAYPLTVNFLRKLNFSGSEEYDKAERRILYNYGQNNSTEVAGYVKSAGRLTEAMVRNAGHMAPADQPEWVHNLIVWWRLHIVKGETLEGTKAVLDAS